MRAQVGAGGVVAILAPLALNAALAAMPQAGTALAETTAEQQLAERWAPVHYQDTDSSDPTADYLSPVDFDGDWIMTNNWEHQARYRQALRGAAYYSVVATATHWFLLYAFYHPRDWTEPVLGLPVSFLMHENDMEGALVIVRRAAAGGAAADTLEAMITVAHRDHFAYTPAGSRLRGGGETVDGSVVMQAVGGVLRPTTRQEAKGHGLYAWDGREFPGGDGIVYYPRAAGGQPPQSGNDRAATYELISLMAPGGLWERRLDAETFASWGTLRGDTYSQNAANAPWGWDDHDDGPGRGQLATDPAAVTHAYFHGLGDFALEYVSNPYRSGP